MFLYIIPAYLMLFTALFNTVCLYNASLFFIFLPLSFSFLLFMQILFVFVLYPCVIDICTSVIILHHVQYF